MVSAGNLCLPMRLKSWTDIVLNALLCSINCLNGVGIHTNFFLLQAINSSSVVLQNEEPCYYNLRVNFFVLLYEITVTQCY